MDGFFSHIILLIFVHIVLYTSCTAQDDSLIVKAQCGSLRGRLEPVVNGLSVRQFLGIPYAQPPTGQLRFARPQPAKQWTGVRDAVTFRPKCPQVTLKQMALEMNLTTADGAKVPQSEDCLSLNVYTPSHATTHDKFTVMVWIHGGSLEYGSGRDYNPSVLVALNDVIVVTINYRLGVLGFFNIPGTDVKGNYGMYDQIQALKWVQQNIAAFGGDPDQVTIFGWSAGGMSVSNHLISPLSKGLFHRVIAQSGSSICFHNGHKVTSSKVMEMFSNVLSCDVKDDQFMECLRSKKLDDILTAQHQVTYPRLSKGPYLILPVVDGEFLPDEPKTLLKQGKINKAEVMMGMTSNEWALASYFVTPHMYKDGGLDMEGFKASLKQTLFALSAHSQLLEDAVLFEYIDHSDPNNSTKLRQASFDIGTDFFAIAPAVIEATVLAQTNHVYFYVFDHTPHVSKFSLWVGAYHGVEISYVFGMPLNMDGFGEDIKLLSPSKFSDLEVGFSRYIMRLWTNFAKHGDPNSGDGKPVTWPHYNTTGHVHLRLALEPKVEYSLRERKAAFWNEFFPKLTRKDAADKAKDGGIGAEEKQKEEL